MTTRRVTTFAAQHDHGRGPPAILASDPLVEYRRRKLALAELIRSMITVAAERRDQGRQAEGRALLASLAEDRFQLAVVGQFSRGKSSLMNAILGYAYLPTGALPMTSVVTTVRYGSQPRVLIQRAGGNLPVETTLEQLDRFVAQSSDQRESLQVISAHVEVPAEILRLGFSFVDTPGIGSAITANTAATTQFLPQADAVIFVTSFDAALSEAEVAFLRQVRRYVEKLFVVVNKADLVNAAEAEKVIRWVRRQLDQSGAGGEAHVFATSARDALAAKQRSDRAALAASGLPDLERTLVHFLTGERSRVFLRQTSARASRLLEQQQLDLRLGRVAQTNYGSSTAAIERFNAALTQPATQVHEFTATLVERIRSQLPARLAEQARAWQEEVSDLLDPERQRRSPPGPRLSGPRLEDSGTIASAEREQLLADWLAQRAIEVGKLLPAIAGELLEQLLALPHAAPRIALDTLGLSARGGDLTPPTWSAADLEPLSTPAVMFDVALDTRRWRARSARRGGTRRGPHEAARPSIDAYCRDARVALTQAADIWAQRVGARVEADLRSAADRVCERLRNPGSDPHMALLDDNAGRLAAFRDALLSWEPVAAEPDVQPVSVGTPPTNLRAPCTICEQIASVPFDYLAELQYQLATSSDRRVQHAASGGFCPLHTWLYAQIAEPVGIALAYAELAESATRSLRRAVDAESTDEQLADTLAHLSPDHDRCLVCQALAIAERDALRRLTNALRERPAAKPTTALCVPHLTAVLATGPGSEPLRALARNLADQLERASDDMRTFALKRQSLRRELLDTEEHVAYQQIIPRVAGDRALARPWRTEADDRLP
jgi:GTP-binding protein EngB required for normal cell division